MLKSCNVGNSEMGVSLETDSKWKRGKHMFGVFKWALLVYETHCNGAKDFKLAERDCGVGQDELDRLHPGQRPLR